MPDTSDNHDSALLQRVKHVVERVRAAERQYGRRPGSVMILPVSKTRPPSDIEKIATAGFTAFGESYLQEAEKKIAKLASLDLQWHFIGPIQSNKTALIARLFHWVHSIDREKVAQRLNDQRPPDLPALNVCLQVNISGEDSKSGISPTRISELASRFVAYPRLRLRGLMAIPARSHDFATQRQAFHAVHEIFNALKSDPQISGTDWDTLSMGMSDDLEAAISEGATIVRIGTDIFGQRTRPAETAIDKQDV
jgi:pyridoxal phosphate enzyme (YggS family)